MKFPVFVVCVEEIMYLLLYNLHDCTFKLSEGGNGTQQDNPIKAKI